MLTSSCGKRRCAQSMDRYQNADERVTTDGNLGKLECDGSGVADDPFRRKHPRAKGLQLLGSSAVQLRAISGKSAYVGVNR